MRISKLELFGFKSFPDRTSLQFGRGISCVVGPNGSGKSNVVDALKWVIGEQSARSLRGAEMSDVIFAGSTERKPVGFAEVSLTLDVDEGEPFPGEYANLQELQVGRRLHRSGASEYLINQVKCRRKDVVDLFLDTGIGTNLYSFIEQGRVDKVVSASPNERRGLIDEAAGISRYKARREEARSRLEATVQQLDRAADVADEMGRRLKVLERQVVKAARFRRARAIVRQREIYLSLVKYRGLAGDRRALQQALREARSEEAAARRGLLRREEDLRLRREEVATVDEAARTWRDELAEVDARLRELHSQEQLQGQRAQEASEQVQGAERELREAARELEGVQSQRVEVEAALAETIEALAAEATGAESRAALLASSSEKVAAAARTRRAADEAWQQLTAEVARREAERVAVEERRSAIPGQVVKLEAALAALVADQEGLHAEILAAEGRREEAAAAEAAAAELLARRERGLADVDAARQRALEAHDAARREALNTLTRARAALDAHRAEQARSRAERARVREARAREARQRRDHALEHARARADAWVDGVTADARRVEQETRAWLEAEEARWRDLLAESIADAEREGESLAARQVEVAEQQVRQALGPLEQAVRRQSAALDRARDDAEEARASLAEVEARIAALRGHLRATERPAALADAVPLVDRLPPDEAKEALAVWGRRASLPALRDAEGIAAALASLPDDAAAELWWWRGEPPEVADAPDAAAALRLHEATGVAVRFPGGRVEADGTVAVGGLDAAAARLAAREELQAAEARAEELAARRAAAQAAAEAAESALAAAREALGAARVDGDRALAEARRGALDRARSHVRTAVDALEAERDAYLEGLRDTLSRRVAEGAGHVEAARGARAEALASVRADLDAVLERALEDLGDDDGGDEEGGVAERALVAAVAEAEARAEAVSESPELPPREGAVSAAASARAAHRGATEARLEAEGEVGQLRDRLAGLEARRADVEGRLDEARRDAAHWAERLTAVEGSLADLRRRVDEAAEARAAAEHAHEAERERHQLVVVQAEGADAARRTLAEREAQQRVRRDELVERARVLQERSAAIEARRADAARRAEEARLASRSAAEELARLKDQRAQVDERLQRERARRSELQEGIREAEGDLGTLRERMDAAVRGTQGLVDRSASVRAEIDALRERMDDRYQVGLPGLLDRIERSGKVLVEADDDVAAGLSIGGTEVEGVEPYALTPRSLDDEDTVRDAVQVVEEARRKLASMGEVHLGAIEEYTELAERHGDLETQRADLEASVAQLRAAIAKMNRTCRERFREAFDRVNENFQVSYPKLLGGGSARLALTDDEDLLETGVEIFVQPPGKRLQHLQLLSGGEKAMTAIALLIALFRVKPSPFCVLDEVDAPLDERNGGRFNAMLRELAETSQFVVITHNRKTMECADTLYGISMTRPGVSTLVTVSLADAPV